MLPQILVAMAVSPKHDRRTPAHRPATPVRLSTLRYWLLWALLIAILAMGINAYFDYRNRELDKRLEQINLGFTSN